MVASRPPLTGRPRRRRIRGPRGVRPLAPPVRPDPHRLRRPAVLLRVPYHNGVDLEHFLAPDPGEEKDEPAFQVICSARSWYGVVVFVFSSASGNWSRVASVSFPLCLAIKDPKALVRYYACGCFCWVNAWTATCSCLTRVAWSCRWWSSMQGKINDRYEFPLQLDLDRDNGKYLSSDADRSIRNLYTLHRITFTPTVQHCSMPTIIGLCLRLKLMQNFPPHFKVDIKVAPGSLANKESVNKQLNDKERVAAALENPNLCQLVDECLCFNDPYSL